MNTELIQVVQLPVIEEQLRSLKDRIDITVADAVSLVCTEETIQTVKAARADLRKQFDDLEERRKAVKAAVLGPYERFEAVYKECVADAFKAADLALKGKIYATESEIKQRCEDSLREHFDELCVANHLEWLEYERAGIRIDMASAKQKTPKKLREQLVQFVARVAQDVDAISNMDAANEILAEYKLSLDAVKAIGTAQDRHNRIEAEREALEAREAKKAVEADAVRRVEALAPPTVQEAPQTLTVTFTVTDTRERLIALREWMKANWYRYE